jgi:hypothetical protein
MYVYKDDEGYKLPTEVVTKHYKEPNVGVVGSPTISSDCIASGFSSSNYMTLPIDYASTDGYTYIFCFTPVANTSSYQLVLSKEYFISITINIDASVLAYNWGTSSNVSLFTATYGTKYWVKTYINGTNKIVSYSTDGKNYTQVASFTDTSIDPSSTKNNNGLFFIGLSSSENARPVAGTIYLDQCYIYDSKGNIVWHGTKDVYTDVETYYGVDYKNLSVNNLVLRTVEMPSEGTDSNNTDNTDSNTDNSGDNSTDNTGTADNSTVDSTSPTSPTEPDDGSTDNSGTADNSTVDLTSPSTVGDTGKINP